MLRRNSRSIGVISSNFRIARKPTRGNVRAVRTYGVTADVPIRLVLAAKAMIVIVLTDQMP
jgi:hypothetical protein